jgi:hypothetical protein
MKTSSLSLAAALLILAAVSCETSAPTAPTPAEAEAIEEVADAIARDVLDQILRAEQRHICPIFGPCWKCAGARRDTTRTDDNPPDPPVYYEMPVNIFPWMPGGPPNGLWD